MLRSGLIVLSVLAAPAWADMIPADRGNASDPSHAVPITDDLGDLVGDPAMEMYLATLAQATSQRLHALPDQFGGAPVENYLTIRGVGDDYDHDGFLDTRCTDVNPLGYVVFHFLSRVRNVRVTLGHLLDAPGTGTIEDDSGLFFDAYDDPGLSYSPRDEVPEPATALLLLAGGALLLRRRRRSPKRGW